MRPSLTARATLLRAPYEVFQGGGDDNAQPEHIVCIYEDEPINRSGPPKGG